MATITASEVKALREATGVGMMECKRALVECDGDKDAAMTYLRERGMAIAGKKADRAANEGLVAASVTEDGSQGSMIEVNCETDFVARNDNFQAFVADLVAKAPSVADDALAEAVSEVVTAKITEIGENIKVRRNVSYTLDGTGRIASYIHLGGKVGVLVEMGCENADNVDSEVLKDAAKDVTLHIAASSPQALSRDEVDPAVVEAESSIFRKQVEGKPENIIDKIVQGKINKFYSQICLLEQGFVKDPDQSVQQYIETRGKEVGDVFSIRRYTRYQLGA